MCPSKFGRNIANDFGSKLRDRRSTWLGLRAEVVSFSQSFTPQLKKILRAAGCSFVRHGKGDHEIWFSRISQKNFTDDAKILSRHTANAVLKQAGLPKEF
jgi:HicA toxin of bacterial toxin-antitoxin,